MYNLKDLNLNVQSIDTYTYLVYQQVLMGYNIVILYTLSLEANIYQFKGQKTEIFVMKSFSGKLGG